MTRPAKAPGLGPLDDPLAGWPNDDLLLNRQSRDRIARDHASLLKVLDWPELRAVFEDHDARANEEGRKCRRFGLSAVACGAAGMLLAALSPVLTRPDWLSGWVIGFIAMGLTILGTGLGLAHWIGARHRSNWLIHRFWTERLRQFYFQFLINNFDLAVKASGNEPALSKYRRCRDEALDRLINDRFRNVPGLIKALEQDEAELSPWLQDDWPKEEWSGVSPDMPISERKRILFRALSKQRFGIQKEYTEKKGDYILGGVLN